ncbi:hypothetical protein [Sneathiella litorea]|uniref:Uncharacterized protein n=1 Tax=Sneathiella litorea TaxID=2606216 RepID=A0A6L8W8S2_9PROT|nr:hypothetical protein [Sneathiella litorea]MZR31505.1 hypothetical protein [Sneathiella litorea]
MKSALAINVVIICAVAFPVQADTVSRTIENLSAVLASKSLCGFNVNMQIVKIAGDAALGDVKKMAEGGRYYVDMLENMDRISRLTNTASGKASFCNTVRTELSAFID